MLFTTDKPNLSDHFRLQAQQNLWANHRLHRACAALADAAYFAPRPCFFGSIHHTLDHILLVEIRYLDRIAERAVTDTEEGETLCPDLPSLSARQRQQDRHLLELVEATGDAGLGRIVPLADMQGGRFPDPLHIVLAHLFQHQIHHRGQVHDLLSQTEVPPPQLDEFFLSQDAARRQREVEELGLL